MPVKPEILKTETIFKSDHFHVEAVDLRFNNGEERRYERLVGDVQPAAVMIVPMIDEDTVVMIREYGVGVEDYQLTLPKGKLNLGEDILEGANRELKEEIGYGAGNLHILKTITNSPAYMQHTMTIVIAMGLYPEWLVGDEPEPILTERFNIADVNDLVAREDVTESRTITALYMARDWLNESLNGYESNL